VNSDLAPNDSNVSASVLQARKALTFLLFPEQDFSWAKHLGIMGFLLTFINILVIFVPSIREVFGIIGKIYSRSILCTGRCTLSDEPGCVAVNDKTRCVT